MFTGISVCVLHVAELEALLQLGAPSIKNSEQTMSFDVTALLQLKCLVFNTEVSI